MFLGNGAGRLENPVANPKERLILSSYRESGRLDINGDGLPDLLSVVNHRGEFQISVQLGKAGDTFGEQIISTHPSEYVEDIHLADFNGDGWIDLLTTSLFGNFGLFLGEGDGTFREDPTTYYKAYGRVVVGQFNRDEKPDLAILSGRGVSIRLNSPTFMKGDVDLDMKVDVRDAVLSLRFIVLMVQPTETQKVAADVNDDQAITIQDTIRILQMAIGLSDDTPT